MRSLFKQLVVTSGGYIIWWMVWCTAYRAVIPFGAAFDGSQIWQNSNMVQWMVKITVGTSFATFWWANPIRPSRNLLSKISQSWNPMRLSRYWTLDLHLYNQGFCQRTQTEDAARRRRRNSFNLSSIPFWTTARGRSQRTEEKFVAICPAFRFEQLANSFLTETGNRR